MFAKDKGIESVVIRCLSPVDRIADWAATRCLFFRQALTLIGRGFQCRPCLFGHIQIRLGQLTLGRCPGAAGFPQLSHGVGDAGALLLR